MDKRAKLGLRPRPNIVLGGVAPDPFAAKQASSSAASRPSVMQAPVLVLNATFEPINVTAVRRALVLMLKGVAQAEETNHTEVHSTSEGHTGSFRNSPAELPAHPAAEPRAFAQKYFAARPQYLPVLRSRVSGFGADARSRAAAFARWALHLGESRRLLLRLQQPQGRPHTGRGGDQVAATSATIYAAHITAIDAAHRTS